jgi:hypothetical protein
MSGGFTLFHAIFRNGYYNKMQEKMPRGLLTNVMRRNDDAMKYKWLLPNKFQL